MLAPEGTAARPSVPSARMHVNFDGRVAAAVEDLATDDLRDARRLAAHGGRQTPDDRRLAQSVVRHGEENIDCPPAKTFTGCIGASSGSSLTRFIRFEPTAVKSAVTCIGRAAGRERGCSYAVNVTA